MEIDRETWRNSMVGDDDPLYVLERYSQTMRRLYETVLAMAPSGASGRFAQLLGEIEKMDAQCSDFLYEEAGAKLGYRDALSGLVRFDDWPEDLRLDVCDAGVVVRNIPAWMLGHGAQARYHPLFHKDKRIVYKRQLWRAIINKLVTDWKQSGPGGGNATTTIEPPAYSVALFQFRSRNAERVRDLDNFLPTLSIVVNALRDNHLLLSDAPRHLAYAMEWVYESSTMIPTVDIYIRWMEHPPTAWLNGRLDTHMQLDVGVTQHVRNTQPFTSSNVMILPKKSDDEVW